MKKNKKFLCLLLKIKNKYYKSYLELKLELNID